MRRVAVIVNNVEGYARGVLRGVMPFAFARGWKCRVLGVGLSEPSDKTGPVDGVIMQIRSEKSARSYHIGRLPLVNVSSSMQMDNVPSVVCDDVAVLVSPGEPAPVTRSRRNLLAHTGVLERAMPHATILPLRFGTVAPNEAALLACIDANRGAFSAAMRDVEGQVELGVKAVWRRGLVFTDIVDRDPSLRQLRDRLRTRPASETYYERIELGRRVEASLAQLRVSEAASLLGELLPLAERDAELRLHDDDMVLNRAFLVRRESEASFDKAVQRVAERFDTRMEFRYVGPLPPFNFVTLHAGWLSQSGAGV